MNDCETCQPWQNWTPEATDGKNLQRKILKQLESCRYYRTERLPLETVTSDFCDDEVTIERIHYASCCIRLDTKKVTRMPCKQLGHL